MKAENHPRTENSWFKDFSFQAGKESSATIHSAILAVLAVGALTFVGYLTYRKFYGRGSTPDLPPEGGFKTDNGERINASRNISIDEKRIAELSDRSSLREENLFYEEKALQKEIDSLKGSLTTYKPLVDYIRKTTNTRLKREAIAAFLTVAGVKPALVFADHIDKEGAGGAHAELRSILQNIVNDNPKLQMKEFRYRTGAMPEPTTALLLVNESPLDRFDPRHFLAPLQENPGSLTYLTLACFCHQGEFQTDQMLSYLLGFGPGFDDYFQAVSGERSPERSVFSGKHYEEIGKVFLENGSDLEAQNVGFAVHRERMKSGKPDTRYPPDSPFEKILRETGTPCAYGGIAARTDYFRSSCTLKKWVLEQIESQ